ncbi:SAM-dependent methyltransferase [Nocardia salmonicida]|uniref:SAM-dependent methyltransferase n=1 Tax=Nocardia salmonicida TaxID=53431 RepID=UPI002E2C9179|nr:class I SAM-dependent methyltransferase [Nocardia salmonicida]
MNGIDNRFNDEVIDAIVATSLDDACGTLDIPLVRYCLEHYGCGDSLADRVLARVSEALERRSRHQGDYRSRFEATMTDEHYPEYVGSVDGYYVVPNKRFMAAFCRYPQWFGPGSRVLDLGGGTGRNGLVAAMAGATVDLVEQSVAGCRFVADQAAQLGVADRVRILNTDMCAWQPTTDYSAVVAITVLEHVAAVQRRALAATLTEAMRPGAVLVATAFLSDDPGAIRESDDHSETADHVESYLNQGELVTLFSDLTMVEEREYRKLDTSHGSPHYHSVAEIIGVKR